MKELQKFQNSTFDEFTRQKFIEDQKTIMELSGRLQELQNEVRQPNIQSSSVEESIQRIMGQTNNDCRFRISSLTSSLRQQPLLAGR